MTRIFGPSLIVFLTLLSGRGFAEEAKSIPFKEVTEPQRTAIARGLAFLARTQGKDGSWSGSRSPYPVAMTALAGTAFLAGGNLPGRGKYGRTVDRAVRFLLRHQDSSGLIAHAGSGGGGRPMYGHGFATLFLSQAYGMVSDPERQARIRKSLVRAVRLTAQCQSPNGGWYYQPQSRNDEGSVTITQVQGLRAARNVGIPVPYKTIKRAVDYIRKSQNADGSVNYSIGRGRSNGSPALTAAGLEVLYSAGQYKSKEAKLALEYVSKVLEGRGKRVGGHKTYYHFYVCQAIFQAGDQTYRKYWPKLRAQIISGQKSDGSWPGDYVGNVYGTALNTIVLQLPYRYLPILQR